jgi:hypothetical protein
MKIDFSMSAPTLPKAFSFSKEKLWKNHGKRPCFSFVFLWKDQWQNKGFFLCVFPEEKLKRKHKGKQRVSQRNLCVFPPLIKDKEVFFQSFHCVLPAGKTQRKNPLFCHWSFQRKTKEKQGLFPWFFHSFSLEKLNAFCSAIPVRLSF